MDHQDVQPTDANRTPDNINFQHFQSTDTDPIQPANLASDAGLPDPPDIQDLDLGDLFTPSPSDKHFLHTPPSTLLLNHNIAHTADLFDFLIQARLRLFIFYAGELLLFSSSDNPNLTVPSQIFSGDYLSLPAVEGTESQVAFSALEMLGLMLRQEKLVDLQFVDFAFQEPIVEENGDGFILDLAIVLQVKGYALDDDWVQRKLALFNGHVMVDPSSLMAKFLRCDVSPALMNAVVERYNSFNAGSIAELDEISLKKLVLHTLDIMLSLRTLVQARGEQLKWAVIAQVEKYPFEGLFVMPQSEEQFRQAAEAGYTHFTHGHWEYKICGSISLLHGGETAQIWVADKVGLAQAFDEQGFLQVDFMKAPRRVRWEKKDESRPLSRDDNGRDWLLGPAVV